MNYEKAYKDLIAKIKDASTNPDWEDERFCCVINELFPELKESEDERIRKELIQFVKAHLLDFQDVKYITWLEKQGEQKPADKAEPKFKVGDWVIDKQGIVHQIERVVENVTNHTFSYDLVGGGYFNDAIEGVRLWTIQDAKDGDVLVLENYPFVYNGYLEEGQWPFAYCGMTNNGFEVFDGKLPFTHSCVTPATKEQSKQLFDAMYNAGYMWDINKKGLKKIEQKPINRNFEQALLDLIRDVDNDYTLAQAKRVIYEYGYGQKILSAITGERI